MRIIQMLWWANIKRAEIIDVSNYDNNNYDCIKKVGKKISNASINPIKQTFTVSQLLKQLNCHLKYIPHE